MGLGRRRFCQCWQGKLSPTSGTIHWNGKAPSLTYFRQEQEEESQVDWEKADAHIYRKKWNVPEKAAYRFASGGERMKMRLSAALAERSSLVLLDEPTNHLDSDSLDELIRIIQVTGKDVSHCLA